LSRDFWRYRQARSAEHRGRLRQIQSSQRLAIQLD
jgi:hypothetical protein